MKYVSTDPGESLGYAVWQDTTLLEAGTAELWDFIHCLAIALDVTGPNGVGIPDEELVKRLRGCQHVVLEDWAIYPWKAHKGELDFDKCRTARGIGAMEFICDQANIPYTLQP